MLDPILSYMLDPLLHCSIKMQKRIQHVGDLAIFTVIAQIEGKLPIARSNGQQEDVEQALVYLLGLTMCLPARESFCGLSLQLVD